MHGGKLGVAPPIGFGITPGNFSKLKRPYPHFDTNKAIFWTVSLSFICIDVLKLEVFRTARQDPISDGLVSFFRFSGRPTYLLDDLNFTAILSSIFFFRPLPSELAKRNSTKTVHMFRSKPCDLKRMGYPLHYKSGAQNPLYNLTATLTAYIFGTKHDIDNRASTLTSWQLELNLSKTHFPDCLYQACFIFTKRHYWSFP